LDEAYALPSEEAVTLALRTQQILAYETGVVNTPDPLGGSYFVENLTLQMEAVAKEYIERIDKIGGMIRAIEAGFPQEEIASASYRYQREVEKEQRIIVGANRFQTEEQPINLLQIDQTAQEQQERKLASLRVRRNQPAVLRTLDSLSRAAEGAENTMPFILDAVRSYATVGEICETLRKVFGTYSETTHLGK
jgi:methylmalonyl-CoA mutase N-terminal domain/subunit